MLLPLVGDFVTVPRGGGVLRGVWIGLGSLVDGVEAGRVTARVMCGGLVVEHVTWAVSVRAALVVSGRAEPDVADAARAAALVCGQMDSQRRAFEAWKGRLSEAACERADEQGWCSDFEDFMQNWGLQGRVRDFDVQVQVSGRVSVRVQAPTGSIAEGGVSREHVQELVSGLDELDFQVQAAE